MGGTPHQSPARRKATHMLRAPRRCDDSPRSVARRNEEEEEYKPSHALPPVVTAGKPPVPWTSDASSTPARLNEDEEDPNSRAVLPKAAAGKPPLPSTSDASSTPARLKKVEEHVISCGVLPKVSGANPPIPVASLAADTSSATDASTVAARPKLVPSTKKPRVAILGAGPAGLAAGQALKRAGINPVIFEARARAGGRVLSIPMGGSSQGHIPFSDLSYRGGDLEKKDNNTEIVDIGASIMHGCGDSNQFVLRRAIKSKIRAPLCAGKLIYESTEAAAWYEDGKRIDAETMSRVHRFFQIITGRMGDMARQSKSIDLRTLWNAEKSKLENQWRPLSSFENQILEKIGQRGLGYCAPLSDLNECQALNFKPEAPELSMDNTTTILDDARYFDSKLTNRPLSVPIASMRGGIGDRIVIDGYTPFLINPMKKDLNIRFESIVKKVQVVQNKCQDANGPWSTSYIPNSNDPSVGNAKSAAEPFVVIETHDGTREEFDHAIVALPLGVLQGKNDKSAVKFDPPLPKDKQDAIQAMGMGIHNKIILKFRPEDVFWPEHTPQLNCLDIRFQFFNLHAYGKPGFLLVHTFAESRFFDTYNRTDKEIAMDAVRVLHKAFCNANNSNTRIESTIPRKGAPKKKNNSIQDTPMKKKASGRKRGRTPNAQKNELDEASSPPEKKLKGTGVPGKAKKYNTRKRKRSSPSEFSVVSTSNSGSSEPVTPGGSAHSSPCIIGSIHLKLRLKPERQVLKKQEEEVLDSNEFDAPPPTKKQKRSSASEDIEGNTITPAPLSIGYEETVIDGSSSTTGADTSLLTEEILEEGDARDSVRFPEPVEFHVTRWHQDPFAMGSYSYVPEECDLDLDVMKTPEKMGTSKERIFFAGEHLSELGWQCVHGAHETGVMAAHDVLVAAGLRDVSANFELLDEFPPVENINKPMNKVEMEKISALCAKYLDSPAQFYDVLDEIIFMYHEDLGKAMGGASADSRRKQIWQAMKDIATGKKTNKENPDGDVRTSIVAKFMQKRYFLAMSESKYAAYKTSFSKRCKKERPLMKKPEDFEDILSELLKKKSRIGLKQKFAKEIYEKSGAIVPLEDIEAYLLKTHEIRCQDKKVTAKDKKDQEDMSRYVISSLKYPTLSAFDGWASGDGMEPKSTKKNKKQSHRVGKKKSASIPKSEEIPLDGSSRMATRASSKL